MIVTQQLSMPTTGKKEIVGVYGTSNQAVIQQISRTLPGVDLNFQRPEFVLQDRTTASWLNVAGGW